VTIARAIATPLLLAAGELPGIMVLSPRQPDDPQRRQHVLAPLSARQVGQEQRQLDVLEGRQHRDEVVELEDEADVVGPPAGDPRVGEHPQVLIVDDHAAPGGPVEPGDQVEQGGLARARGAHQGEVFALLDGQVEVDEHRDAELVAAIFLGDPLEDDRMRLAHGLQYS